MEKFKNKDLYSSLKILVKKYYEIKNNYRNQELHELFEKSDEYKSTINIFSSNDMAKKLFYKKFRKKDYDIYIGGPQEIIDDFVNQQLEKNEKFSEIDFDKYYVLLENFLYKRSVDINYHIFLCNYEQEVEKIDLATDICIRSSTDIEKKEELNENFNAFILSHYLSDYVIEINRKIKKEINNDSSLSYHHNIEEYNIINRTIDIILNTLRVQKKSSVFLSNRLLSIVNIFAGGSRNRVTSLSTNLVPIFEGKKHKITNNEIDNIINIFKFLLDNFNEVSQQNRDELRLRIAVTRLNDAYYRSSLIDRLIDYFIGLEALFLPDGDQELSYRLAARIAFNLRNKFEDRSKLYMDMKEYYNIRSKGVHGKKFTLTVEEVDRVENLLRESILLWKLDKDIFNEKNFPYIFFK